VLQGVVTGNTAISTNALTDAQFGNAWTLSAGAARKLADALLGYALGKQPYYCELSPSTSLIRSAKSELVPVSPNQRLYFKVDCQRGTSLGSGSRLNPGHEWLLADGVTTVGTPVEGTQQTPSSLTAGAAPVSIFWSDVAPSTAAFVRIKPYTPALASSSGTFRVEAPVISFVPMTGESTIIGPDLATFRYSSTGTAETGEFSRDLAYVLRIGGVAQTAGVTWTYKVITGTANGFTNASGSQSMSGSGTGTLTASSLATDESMLEITATTAFGVAKCTTTLRRQYAAPNATGGTGAGSTLVSKSSGFTSINSTTFTDITGTLSAAAMPAGVTTANLNATLTFWPAVVGGAGSWTVELKWQRNISGVWTDQGGTPVVSGGSSVEHDVEFGNQQNPVTITNNQSISGLTAGVAYDWRCVARLTSGTRSHAVSGNVSVTS
jgi:hypothetical protein